MGIFSRFEGRMEDTVEGAANKMFDSPISPVQIAKKAEKQMRREKIVGAGKQYAPTLYTILVNTDDDRRLFGYYPTLAGETETYLSAKAVDEGLVMDGQPLVRFIVDEGLKRGKFEIIAELVASPIIVQLRTEEMERYGIGTRGSRKNTPPAASQQRPQPQTSGARAPLPNVPEDEIDYSIDYGEYTFNSQNFEDVQEDEKDEARNDIPHNQAQGGVPNTVVFSPGSGNARPIPDKVMVRASLLDTSNNRSYDLATNRLLLGREKSSDIVVDDINASRAHAELRYESQGVWMISDLGSTNGTYVNGADVATQALKDGDYLTIGTTNYLFMQSQ